MTDAGDSRHEEAIKLMVRVLRMRADINEINERIGRLLTLHESETPETVQWVDLEKIGVRIVPSKSHGFHAVWPHQKISIKCGSVKYGAEDHPANYIFEAVFKKWSE